MSLVADALHRISKVVHTAPALAEVSVENLGDGDWRVSLPAGGTFALLGLISLNDRGRYEVISVSHPLDEIVADTLDDAIDALRPRLADVPATLAGARV